MVFKKIVISITSIIICILCVCAITGCSDVNSNSIKNNNEPYLSYGQDAAQYTTFLDKEITPVTNYLVSNLNLLRKLVPSNSRNKETERIALRTAQDDLKEIKIIYERIDRMPAGKKYESNKKRVLKTLKDITSNFEDYIVDLKGVRKKFVGYSVFSVYQTNFSNLYIELTDEFTNYYK